MRFFHLIGKTQAETEGIKILIQTADAPSECGINSRRNRSPFVPMLITISDPPMSEKEPENPPVVSNERDQEEKGEVQKNSGNRVLEQYQNRCCKN